jgi:diacylglycerol O-acyltransferase
VGRQLTPLDGSFLRAETPNAHMHVGWSGLFRPPEGRSTQTLERLRASIACRLQYAPRFRQRLAFPPLGLGEPFWVDDPRFDISRHVTRLARPRERVSRARFERMTDEVLSEPLDRSRPLWHIYLVPRVEDGSVGLISKMHHAMVDGKSAVELGLLLFDTEPDASPPQPDDWRPQPEPGRARLAWQAAADQAQLPLDAARLAARMAAAPRDTTARGMNALARVAAAVREDVLKPAPASYVNVPIGPERTLVRHRVPLERVLQAKDAAGVKLNDVCLAAVAGAMRELAIRRDEEPKPLKAMVPVSTRQEDEQADMGNRISFVFIDLPLNLPSALARLRRVAEATRAFKRSGRASGGELVLGALGYLPGLLKNQAARLAGSARVYNLTVSNIPGPRFPVYMLGAELEEAYPVVPLSEDHALSVGMFSYRDSIFFGCYAHPAAFPEATDELPAALDDQFRALARLPARGGPRRVEAPGNGDRAERTPGGPRPKGSEIAAGRRRRPHARPRREAPELKLV